MGPAEARKRVWQGADGRRRLLPPAAGCVPPAQRPAAACAALLLTLQGVPFYRIFAADSRCPRDGKHLEQLGHYDPVPGGCSSSGGSAAARQRQRSETGAGPLQTSCSVSISKFPSTDCAGKDGNKSLGINIERLQ